MARTVAESYHPAMQRKHRSTLALVTAMWLAPACMLTPHDEQEIPTRSALLDFSGYHLKPGKTIEVVAVHNQTGAPLSVGSTTSSTSSLISMEGEPLYAWEVEDKRIPTAAWGRGHRGDWAFIYARSGTTKFMAVEKDWVDCYEDNSTFESFRRHCAADGKHLARIDTKGYCTDDSSLHVVSLSKYLHASTDSYRVTVDLAGPVVDPFVYVDLPHEAYAFACEFVDGYESQLLCEVPLDALGDRCQALTALDTLGNVRIEARNPGPCATKLTHTTGGNAHVPSSCTAEPEPEPEPTEDGEWWKITCRCQDETATVDIDLKACNVEDPVGFGFRCKQLESQLEGVTGYPTTCNRIAVSALHEGTCNPSIHNWDYL
jgi:hypothetical protein